MIDMPTATPVIEYTFKNVIIHFYTRIGKKDHLIDEVEFFHRFLTQKNISAGDKLRKFIFEKDRNLYLASMDVSGFVRMDNLSAFNSDLTYLTNILNQSAISYSKLEKKRANREKRQDMLYKIKTICNLLEGRYNHTDALDRINSRLEQF